MNAPRNRISMSEFKNVTIVREANVYFEGKVTSRTVIFEDGTRKTLGFMQPGEYTFDTGAAETMELLAGAMKVMLPGAQDWKTFSAGESFDVPANSRFELVVNEYSDYCCSYLES